LKATYIVLFYPHTALILETMNTHTTEILLTIAVILILTSTSGSSETPEPDKTLREYEIQGETNTTLPECFSDYDCGLNATKTTCFKDYVVEEYYTIKCVNPGKPNATCVNQTEREYLDWCRPGERCVEGRTTCMPAATCSDGVRNQGETGIDCGGPCKPCPSCGNGIQDGDETGVDCGGACTPCEIYCTRDESCGLPHWTGKYCGRDNNSYQEYITYECVKPGEYGSWCRKHKKTILVDYCGPINKCIDGECIDPKKLKMSEWKEIKMSDEGPGREITVETWYGPMDVRVN
jgi:hypothetical protein